MGALFSFTISAGVVLLGLWLAYKWFMAGEKMHAYNRAVLMCIYAVSFVALPLWHALTALHDSAAAIGVIPGDLQPVDMDVDGSAGDMLWRILLWVYVLGAVAVALATVAAGIRLWHTVRRGRRIDCGDCVLVLTADSGTAPFSWRRYVVMSEADYASAGGMILLHERQHLRLCHWLDLLIAQCVVVVLWYNPAAWLMRDELRTVHEYQADAGVLAAGAGVREYQILLIKKAVGARFPSLVNSLNHSKLKKRITMMYSQKKKGLAPCLRTLALVPAIAGAIALVNVPAVAYALGSVRSAVLGVTPVEAVATGETPTVGKVSQNPASEQASQSSSAERSYAEFPGGDGALFRYIAMNLEYPEEAKSAGIEGLVVVSLHVTAEGVLDDVRVTRSAHPLLDEAALKVIRGIDVRFIPARENGRAVASTYALPINFKIPQEDQGNRTKIVIN